MTKSANIHRAMQDAVESGSAPVDVLAAERFGVPAPDSALHHETLQLPPDPVGDEPHDVLAAEEFAMPAPEECHPVLYRGKGRKHTLLRVVGGLLPMLTVWLLRRARRSRG